MEHLNSVYHLKDIRNSKLTYFLSKPKSQDTRIGGSKLIINTNVKKKNTVTSNDYGNLRNLQILLSVLPWVLHVH